MPDINTINQEVKLIRKIGNVIVKLDEARSTLNRETPERKKLDDLRDCLDIYQRNLVRNGTRATTDGLNKHLSSLSQINKEIEGSIQDVNRIADTLNNLVKFMEVLDKLVDLVPK